MDSNPEAPLEIASIAQVHAFVGQPPPAHPLISVIGATWQPPLQILVPVVNRKIHSQLYAVSLKCGDECSIAFGRQVHDAQAGTVVFLAPGQTVVPLDSQSAGDAGPHGWTVMFHPDALVGTPLAERIRTYAFFQYAPEEALHLTGEEQVTLSTIVQTIDREARTPDAFSGEVLSAHLQLLFGYCLRFYGRQFQARARVLGKVASRLTHYLDAYLASARPRDEGLPTVAACARELGYSADYLSDLLREETGHGARDHIHRAVIDAAKRRLAASSDSISEVAYALGFEQPQHFSKLFKQKTGHSPGAWRDRG
jgi:AraC family transcriptional activator of pobA